MRISQLTLTNFRNYSKRTFSFDPELTLAVGPNGSGKTNILEAIYLLATGESWRGETTEEMIRFDEDVAHVEGVISENSEYSEGRIVRRSEDQRIQKSGNQEFRRPGISGSQSFPSVPNESTLHMTLSRGAIEGKRVSKIKYKVDGVAKRKSDFVGRLKVVLFEPQSLMIVIGDPEHRREFLDETLLQTDLEYRNDLYIYSRALRIRNRLLDVIRDGKAHREQLEFWERAMVKHGERIQEKRREIVEWINARLDSQALVDARRGQMVQIASIASKGPSSLGPSLQGQSFFELRYEPSVMSEERLTFYREREIAAGFSLVGPQRDDFMIITSGKREAGSGKGRPLAQYGSRGEQRMAMLMLKLSEAQWIEGKTDESSVLLLDDIYSELDSEHDQLVDKLVRGRQTIITATEMPSGFHASSNIVRL